jgi:hypothetical protein
MWTAVRWRVTAEVKLNIMGRKASRLGKSAPHLGQTAAAGHLTVGIEHLTDGLAVPMLLIIPAGEEGRDIRVTVGAGDEHVPEVADGVALDVVHVAQAAQGVRVEGLIAEGPRSRSSIWSRADGFTRVSISILTSVLRNSVGNWMSQTRGAYPEAWVFEPAIRVASAKVLSQRSSTPVRSWMTSGPDRPIPLTPTVPTGAPWEPGGYRGIQSGSSRRPGRVIQGSERHRRS